MALKRNERYPGRFDNPSTAHPQGAFKNRTSPTAQDGSYLESDWANDWDGFFARLLTVASVTANGNVDTGTSSQYYDALMIAITSALGTAAQRNVGAGTNQIPDMNSFQSGSNGFGTWIKHPSGVIIQFGLLPASGPAANIAFPIPFTTNPSYSLSPTATTGIMSVSSGSSTTRINDVRTFNAAGTSLTNGVSWIAIGL